MPVDWGNIFAGFVFLNIGLSVFFVNFHGGLWLYNSFVANDSAATKQDPSPPHPLASPGPDPEAERLEKDPGVSAATAPSDQLKRETGESSGQDAPAAPSETVEEENQPRNISHHSLVVEEVVTRLVEKLKAGEITVKSCACAGSQGEEEEAGRKNVTHVTHVTRVTRVQYQCLLGDKTRWAVLERDLKQALSEEMTFNDDRLRTEVRAATQVLNHTLLQRQSEAVQHMTDLQDRRVGELQERLQEVESRLALEHHAMEIRGFMKIDTFGPLLLGLGVMQILLMFCVGLLFGRRR